MSATILPFKRPPADVVKAKKAEIAKRYAKRKKYKHASATQLAAIRITELNRIFQDRHGEELADNAASRQAIMLVAHHLARLEGDPLDRLMKWGTLHARWLTLANVKRILGKARHRPKFWKADDLANEIGLTMFDRQRLHITTIGATDCNKRQRKARRKHMDRERKRRARAAKKAAKIDHASAP